MLKVFRLTVMVFATLTFTQAASAYGVEPTADVTKQENVSDVRVADACTPRLSPRMAAALGLPILSPISRGCGLS